MDASLNISTSHFTCTPSAFEVILQLTRYTNYLLTYLLTYKLRTLKHDDLLSRDRAGRKRQAVEGHPRRVKDQLPQKTTSAAARESSCPRCGATCPQLCAAGSQMYAAAAASTSTPLSAAASRGLLMDVETTVQFLSTSGPHCCQAAAFNDIGRPSDDLDTLTLTTPYHSDYWLTFRSSKLSQLTGQSQSAISPCMTTGDVIDDECFRPEIETADAELGSLPRRQTSTSFDDVALRSQGDQTRVVS